MEKNNGQTREGMDMHTSMYIDYVGLHVYYTPLTVMLYSEYAYMLYIIIYYYILLYIIIYYYILLYIITYYYISLYIIISYYISLYIII